MKLTRTSLLCALLTLASLFIAGLSWAQGSDTPIIIADGSLTMESQGVPWSQYAGGGTRRHPHVNKTVTAVDLTVNGNSQTISFAGEKCTVTAQYGKTAINVTTGNNGKGLQVATNFGSDFHRGDSDNQMAHNDEHNKLGAITVKKGSQTVFTGTGNGGSKITIHYQ
jgi:hypothetical protein